MPAGQGLCSPRLCRERASDPDLGGEGMRLVRNRLR